MNLTRRKLIMAALLGLPIISIAKSVASTITVDIPYEDRIKQLDELVEIQCSEGNYDYDAYMHGMANGMLLAQAVMKDQEPEYINMNDKEFYVDKVLIGQDND